MILKRKRSESELSFNSAFSSPRKPGDNIFDFSMPCAVVSPTSRGFFSPTSRSSTPSHLHSRTMKRYRNNKPSEEEVHQRTLNLLFSAQQHHQKQAAQGLSPNQMAESITTASTPSEVQYNHHRTHHQRSLHSFWNLPPSLAVPKTSETAPSSLITRSNSCEDCGAGLGDGDDMMMDIDSHGFTGEDHSCGACGKTVCFSCSVSNLGDHRRCLVCAGQRVGITEIGWKTAGVGVY